MVFDEGAVVVGGEATRGGILGLSDGDTVAGDLGADEVKGPGTWVREVGGEPRVFVVVEVVVEDPFEFSS